MGLSPILPVKLQVTISTMLNFDGHCDGDGVGMCKQPFRGHVATRLILVHYGVFTLTETKIETDSETD